MIIEGCKKLSDGTVVCFPVESKVESKKEKVDVERPRQAQRPKEKREKMELVSLHIPTAQLKALDGLVTRGAYPNRSEAIRDAIRQLLDRYRDLLVPTNEAQPQ
jgi:hypothetical protein